MVSLVASCSSSGQRYRFELAGQHSGPLERDQTVTLDVSDFIEEVLDPAARIDGYRHQGEILRQGEQAVGSQMVLEAKAFGAAQHDAHLDPLTSVQIEQRIGDELVIGSVALAEVCGELQTVVVNVHR